MRQLLKKVFIFLFVLLLFPMNITSADVFELYTGEVKGAYRDLTVTKVEDKYFLNKEDLLPGDTIKGKYEITNTSTRNYELTLKSMLTVDSPSSAIKGENGEEISDDLALIKDINLKLTLDGEVIYDGSATGEDNFTGKGGTNKEKTFTDGIFIGNISNNTKKILEAEFTIPNKLDNDYEEAWARVDWIFSAKWAEKGGGGKEPDPKPKPDPKPSVTPEQETIPDPIPDEEIPLPAPAEIPDEPFETPDTGDSIIDIIMYGIITIGAIAAIILVIFSKKKEQN